MKMDKLFNVLVLGGSLLAANAALAQESRPAANSSSFQEEAAKLKPALCKSDDTNVCIPDGHGKTTVKAGFECCWGTSCDAQ